MSILNEKIFITTCAEDKAEKFKTLLEPKGAQVANFPLISIHPANDNSQVILKELSELETYNWIVFTSTNGVKYFFYWIVKLFINFNFHKFKFAVIGNATYAELETYGIKADFNGESQDSNAFAKQLDEFINDKTQKFLYPTGNLTMKNIENAVNVNHSFKKLVVYNTIESKAINNELSDILQKDVYDLVLFLSPSAVRGFVNSISNTVNLKLIKAIPIGIVTKQAMEDVGIKPAFTPSIPNIEIMVNEIENYYNT
ncbi:MAG: uroporphyrinogen-III synthase [Salinivirgaceae bacterium]|nr:uroporphyrinogen-III synthase [Salinivirgaceae bacterium]